jgi:hypothetical protein
LKRRSIARADAEKHPYLIWNAFINLIGLEKYEDLSPEQRPARLVSHYHNEVYNGGHDQYFHNRRGQHLSETLAALTQLRCNLSARNS